jgi:hypothetical protein
MVAIRVSSARVSYFNILSASPRRVTRTEYASGKAPVSFSDLI